MERSDQTEVFQNPESSIRINKTKLVHVKRNRLFSESALNYSFR